MQVSSAYNVKSILTQIMYRIGPNTVPCDTPVCVVSNEDLVFLTPFALLLYKQTLKSVTVRI